MHTHTEKIYLNMIKILITKTCVTTQSYEIEKTINFAPYVAIIRFLAYRVNE